MNIAPLDPMSPYPDWLRREWAHYGALRFLVNPVHAAPWAYFLASALIAMRPEIPDDWAVLRRLGAFAGFALYHRFASATHMEYFEILKNLRDHCNEHQWRWEREHPDPSAPSAPSYQSDPSDRLSL